MVDKDRPNYRLSPEEKVARLVISRKNLSPPVDVRELASNYADVEEDDIPVSLDAVMLRRPQGHKQPLIILNKRPNQWPERVRFTLAHEIGHIIIPYHPGKVACHVKIEENEDLKIGDIGFFEGGANRFASELLMPTDWVESVVDCESCLQDMFYRIVEEARVSYAAARIKLVKSLPANCISVLSDESGSIIKMQTTGGTSPNLVMSWGDRSDPFLLYKKLDRNSIDKCTISRGRYAIRFWRLDLSCPVPHIEDPRKSSDILREIFDDVLGESPFRDSLRASINGIVGALNVPSNSETPEKLYGAMKARFGKIDIQKDMKRHLIANHPKFDSFLVAKVRETFRKKLRWQ